MKTLRLAALIVVASLLAAYLLWPVPTPNSGYVGYVFAYYQGQIAAGRQIGAYKDIESCRHDVKADIADLKERAPVGVSVAGACYPIPAAPPPVRKTASNSTTQPFPNNGSQTL